MPIRIEALCLYPTIIHRVKISALIPYNEELAEIAIRLAIAGDITKGGSKEAHHVAFQTKSILFERPEKCFTQLKHYHQLALREYLQTDTVYRKRFKNGALAPHETVCWAYVQNNKQVSSYVHHHGGFGVTALYYARAPKDLPGNQGSLSFVDPRGPGITSLLGSPLPSEASFLKPEEGTMLLFPSWLQHRPIPMPDAEGWRVAFGIDANFKFRLNTRKSRQEKVP